MTEEQQAMAVAMLYPEGGSGGRGKKGNPIATIGFSVKGNPKATFEFGVKGNPIATIGFGNGPQCLLCW